MVNVNNNNGNIKINDATVLFPDVRASNGILHIMDQVLIPPTIDVPTFLSKCGSSNNKDYSSSSSSSMVVPESIQKGNDHQNLYGGIPTMYPTGIDPYKQQLEGTTPSYNGQQPTMYPTGPDPYNTNHHHDIYYDYSTTHMNTYQYDYPPPPMTYRYPPLPRREYKVLPPTPYPTTPYPPKPIIYPAEPYSPPKTYYELPPTYHPTEAPPTQYPTLHPTPCPTPQPTTQQPTPARKF